MSSLTVAVVADDVRLRLCVEDGESISIGSSTSDDVQVPSSLVMPRLTIAVDGESVTAETAEESVSSRAGARAVLGAWGPAPIEISTSASGPMALFDLTGQDEILIGPQSGASVSVSEPGLALSARRHGESGWIVSITGDNFFVNSYRQAPGRVVVENGDRLGVGTCELVFFSEELQITASCVESTQLVPRAVSAYEMPHGYPDVRRSPRMIHRPPEGKITINQVAALEEKKQPGQLAKLVLPPLAMLAGTVVMAVMRGNIIFVLAFGLTTLITLVLSVSGYVRSQKAMEQKKNDRETFYREYLTRKAVEISAVRRTHREGALHHYPDVVQLNRLGCELSPRIFEKTRLHFDFLHYRLGLGTVEASQVIEFADAEHSKRGDELHELGHTLFESSRTLESMPISSDLMHGPVGYVGPRRLVIEQLQLLVSQLAVFHSYHDLQFVMVFPEDELPDWSWMRWYRHASLQEVNVRGFVYDQRSRDQVLSSLNQILKARQNVAKEAGKTQPVFLPHYVVVVLDESLIVDHVVMEFFREDPTVLGCSVIFVHEAISSLSENVTTVVDVQDKETGVLVLEQGELKNTRVLLDHLPVAFDKERLPRAIGALNHLKDLKSSIPESVTFLELYGVSHVEELDILRRWSKHSPHRSLGVPLGLRGKGDVVKLDLHEKAHGPHGLVAGTTGSGKSEIIQSYILSLAVNFHPHDVAFLLIDYKGGGMANLFADLPHLLGTITNLDGAQSMRALVSINAELKRRQRTFSAHDVNHINQYQKLFKNGDAAEPMPHLFLISDEFAELKAEQPEFMAELVSTARIGRSLGIHLILATQKPSGVVNDQIWSNSKFKLALKVADRSDSMEILKTPDAAEITLPGRAYLQVGNNEIYELFQSAWSGADYQPVREESASVDHTIYAINKLGQYEALNEDLSGLDRVEEVKQTPSELEAVVLGARDVARAAGVAQLPSPWLPPLAERLFVTDLHPQDYRRGWLEPKSALQPVIGMVDLPSRQSQVPLTLDLSGDGHLAVYSSPGYGKSTFMQTLVMDLARAHSPEHLNVYLLDFGTNGLLSLRGLPHVADTMALDDTEKVQKFVQRIDQQLKLRKQLLAQHAVASLAMFERASGRTFPSILVVLDGVESMKGSSLDEMMTTLMNTIAREGAGLGVHLVLSAGRQASLRVGLAGNIKTHVVLRLNDDAEARSIVGRTALLVDDLPGRGMLKLEQPEIFQTALPAAGADMLEIVTAIQAEAASMDADWSGVRPEPIPVIPEDLALETFASRGDTKSLLAAGTLPVGLDCETVRAVGLDLARSRQMLVVCRDSGVVAGTMARLWDGACRAFPHGALVFDDHGGSLRGLKEKASLRMAPASSSEDVLAAALRELDERMALYQDAATSAARPTLSDFSSTLDPLLVFVADIATLAGELGKPHEKDLVRLLTDAPTYAMPLVLGGTLATVGKGYDEVSKIVKKTTAGLVVGKMAEQTILKASNIGFREPEPVEGHGYLVVSSTAVRVKLPT